jgi:hypothetical protein
MHLTDEDLTHGIRRGPISPAVELDVLNREALPIKIQKREHDPINPAHYKDLAVEPIAAIEAWGLGFNLGNAVKYIARAEHKGATLEDLKKARWYLDREITNRATVALSKDASQ